MKYIYTTVIFLILLLLTTNIIDFNYKQEVENINLDNNKIERIVIDVEDANVAVSTTVDNDLKVEHLYSSEQNPTSNIYAYQNGTTLYVNEYPYNVTNLITKKETINIYIPEDLHLSEVDVITDTGQISVDSLNSDSLNLTTLTGNIDLATVTTNKLEINGDKLGLNISNSVFKTLNVNISRTSMNIINTIADDVTITNEILSTVKITKLLAKNIIIDGLETNVELNLSSNLDYSILTSAVITNSSLEKTETGYSYLANDQKTVINYQIENVSAVKVTFEDPTVSSNE